MSRSIQQCLQERRLYGNTVRRNSKQTEQYPFDERIYSDSFIMSHMTLEKELQGHTGCVNTLDWSMTGDKLLTGSDDTKLNIYLTFENYKLAETIATGHRANIFTAKFMPQTSDAIIVSGAGDSEVRIFDLHNTDQKLDSMYVCHSDQLKKVCVYHDNPFEFLTCSQDGTIRHFDRRVPHLCSPHNVRSFITAQNKPAIQYPLPKCHDLHYGCPRPIVDYSKYNIELNCMSINQLQPHYFAIAGMNDYIYLHDKRMLPSQSQHHTTNNDTSESLKCVKRFSPSLDGTNRPNKHITACRFSDANGYELLGSWSADGIYLFNINDDPVASSIRPTNNTTHTTPTRTTTPTAEPLSLAEQKKAHWEILLHDFKSHQLDRCLEAMTRFLNLIREEDPLGRVCIAIIHAACVAYCRYDRDSWYLGSEETWQMYFLDDELETMIEKLAEAERYAAISQTTSWQCYWGLSVGYWLLRGGVDPIPQIDRERYLMRSIEAYDVARQRYDQDEDSVYVKMMEKFRKVLDRAQRRTSSSADTQQVNLEDEDDMNNIWKWAQLMYISLYSVNEIGALLQIPPSLTLSSNNNDDDDDDDDVSLYTNIMSRQIMDLYRRGGNNSNGNENDDSSDSDLDLEELGVFRESSNLQNFETDVGVVKPRMKYTGHRNVETVKDVDFYGLHDEYVMSGSDGGYLFIWDKKSGKIVQILQADGDIVNVAKGHPHLPILAVSGIDNTTKIFTPTSQDPSTSRILEPNNPSSYSASSVMHNQQEIISTNRESNSGIDSDIYITRSMIAALSRIGRRHRIRVLSNRTASDDSDDTVMYFPQHGVYLTDEDMSNNSHDSEADSEAEGGEEDDDDEE